MWLCMKWRNMVHGCMVSTERAEMAAVSRGTSHATTKQHCSSIHHFGGYSKHANERERERERERETERERQR